MDTVFKSAQNVYGEGVMINYILSASSDTESCPMLLKRKGRLKSSLGS